MIELTLEQGQALLKPGELPPRARDVETQTTYVLIREEVYDRIKNLFAEEEDSRFINTMYSHAIEAFGNDGWNDPAMDVYNHLDPRKPERST